MYGKRERFDHNGLKEELLAQERQDDKLTGDRDWTFAGEQNEMRLMFT